MLRGRVTVVKEYGLIFHIIITIMASLIACHSSTKIEPERRLTVCVAAHSYTGLGESYVASNVQAFVVIGGERYDLERIDDIDGCTVFFGDFYETTALSSVTAIDPHIGAITLMDPSSDEISLRLHDLALPIKGASAVRVTGWVNRSEENTSVIVGGEGIGNIALYGDFENVVELPPHAGEFELNLGVWENAPVAFIYFLERSPGESFSAAPRLSMFPVYRMDGIAPIRINFAFSGTEDWADVAHDSYLAPGILSCSDLFAGEYRAYTAPIGGYLEIVQATLRCTHSGALTVDGLFVSRAPWLVHRYTTDNAAIRGGIDAEIRINAKDAEDYLIPNIASYDLDISAERGVSGSVSLSGANASTSVSLRSFIQTGERELVWDIYTERNDLIEIDPDEYALIREAIGAAIDIESLDYHLQIRDGYDGKPWETATAHAESHHSFFSVKLNSSP